MDLGLSGKTAIVAAASSGLGRAVARELVQEGARVAICSRDPQRIQDAARDVGAALAAAVDVTREEDVHAFVRRVEAELGPVDICIANSGGPPSKLFAQTTTADWESAFRNNFLSTLFFAQATVAGMRQRRWGRFVAITSSSVKQPIEGLILSNSIRSAVSGLMKTLSIECGPDNVLVHQVCPGYTATDRLLGLANATAERESIARDEVIARWSNTTSLKRVGTPEEFAAVVAFLCSERASYVTGSAIAIDGGQVRGVFS